MQTILPLLPSPNARWGACCLAPATWWAASSLREPTWGAPWDFASGLPQPVDSKGAERMEPLEPPTFIASFQTSQITAIRSDETRKVGLNMRRWLLTSVKLTNMTGATISGQWVATKSCEERGQHTHWASTKRHDTDGDAMGMPIRGLTLSYDHIYSTRLDSTYSYDSNDTLCRESPTCGGVTQFYAFGCCLV